MRSKISICEETSFVNDVEYKHTFFGSHMNVRGSDGSFSEFFSDHYSKVRKAREQAGMSHVSHTMDIDHPLTGKQIVEKDTGKIYDVEKVSKQWYRGWYLLALVCNNKSHGTRVIENISCIDPTILEDMRQYQTEYTVINKMEE